MRRSSSVTWAAAAIIVESLPPLALGLFSLLQMFGIAPVQRGDPSVFLSGFEYLGVFVMATMFGIWGFISGVGLFAIRPWARYTSIVFAVITIIIFGSYLAIAIEVMLRHKHEPIRVAHELPQAVGYGIGIEIFYIGVSVWLLLLLNRPRVVQEFEGGSATSSVER